MKLQHEAQMRVMAALLDLELMEAEKCDVETGMVGRLLGNRPDAGEGLRPFGQARDGSCIDCGEDIPLIRLQACPNTSRCVDCQTRHERQSEPVLRVRTGW